MGECRVSHATGAPASSVAAALAYARGPWVPRVVRRCRLQHPSARRDWVLADAHCLSDENQASVASTLPERADA